MEKAAHSAAFFVVGGGTVALQTHETAETGHVISVQNRSGLSPM